MDNLRFTRRQTKGKQPRKIRVALFPSGMAVIIRVRNGHAEIVR